MKLRGKNAIVTGGSRGLGRAIVEAFLREGANVLFCARNPLEVEQSLCDYISQVGESQVVRGFACDVSNTEEVARLFDECRLLGDLHILVNNAGVYGPLGPIEDIPLDAWMKTIEVNVAGALLCSQQAIPGMKTRRYGKLIQISGGGAAPIPNCSGYSVSKAAVTRLTECLAEELRGFGIDSNAVAPGPLFTKLTQDVLDAGPEKVGQDFFDKNVGWAKGKAISPEIGANVCVYLASEESDGVTGKLIAAQWDPWHTLHEHKQDLDRDVYTMRRIVPADRGMGWDK